MTTSAAGTAISWRRAPPWIVGAAERLKAALLNVLQSLGHLRFPAQIPLISMTSIDR
jgi:hypothetical protein